MRLGAGGFQAFSSGPGFPVLILTSGWFHCSGLVMSNRIQIRIGGLGGQGVVLAGLLLGEAGVIDGKYVSGSNYYGARARGSECKSEIILSEDPIDFPLVSIPDILLALSQSAYDSWHRDLKETSGLIFYDEGVITPRKKLRVRQMGFPATEVATKRLNDKQVANLILLGGFVEITRMVSSSALRRAIKQHIHQRLWPLNLKAFQAGAELARRIHG